MAVTVHRVTRSLLLSLCFLLSSSALLWRAVMEMCVLSFIPLFLFHPFHFTVSSFCLLSTLCSCCPPSPFSVWLLSLSALSPPLLFFVCFLFLLPSPRFLLLSQPTFSSPVFYKSSFVLLLVSLPLFSNVCLSLFTLFVLFLCLRINALWISSIPSLHLSSLFLHFIFSHLFLPICCFSSPLVSPVSPFPILSLFCPSSVVFWCVSSRLWTTLLIYAPITRFC